MSHNQASEMTTELTSASRTNILSLNTDCLDAIFSSKCLSIKDFCSIAEAHIHLNKVVASLFAKHHKNYEVKLSEDKFDLENTKRILSNFGAFISELSITARRSYSEEIISQCLDWVMGNCGYTLESLKLDSVKITEDQSMKLKPLFGKLQKISLKSCDVSSGKTSFNNCESLIELELVGVKFDDRHAALEKTFPKLDRFEYWNSDDSIGDSFWNQFFSRQRNLKALHLQRWRGICHLLPMVAVHCKELAELTIAIEQNEEKFRKALCSILTLGNLNKLKIECFGGRNITKFIEGLATLKSLEFLSLSYVVGDFEFVTTLSKLTRLQSLELKHCRGLTNLNPLGELEELTELKIRSNEKLTFDPVAMIKRLTSLKTLHLYYWSFRIDKLIYQRIIDVLRERQGSLEKTLQMSCYTAKNFVSDSRFDKILRITKY